MSPAAEGRGHPETVHAGCVVLGSAGVLIRGPSGSGKSALAIALIEAWRLRGLYSALVSDDRVHLALPNDRLIASAPETISGLIEQHGRGIRSLPDLPRVVVRLIVDLLPRETIDRMPEPAALMVAVSGVLNACDTMAGATDGGGASRPRMPPQGASWCPGSRSRAATSRSRYRSFRRHCMISTGNPSGFSPEFRRISLALRQRLAKMGACAQGIAWRHEFEPREALPRGGGEAVPKSIGRGTGDRTSKLES
ncbi:HPr kinase/phosphatase C-terminal domain-containing protein [Breoghania sp. L-A4]|uniref:HPr kinase/phosphorylase n=1 Tax=Breoghania sp. L-A4 TaxID=2304600 RepID=UPI000E35F324|nr:HPr kinase/phosphatase C-terminal domain-containing protein [Breoghania sp. L-A4]AXS39080.1 hypothetical protein D1F64_02145 [Breoghania sp. L-A4]